MNKATRKPIVMKSRVKRTVFQSPELSSTVEIWSLFLIKVMHYFGGSIKESQIISKTSAALKRP
jgi:hypothetical protein